MNRKLKKIILILGLTVLTGLLIAQPSIVSAAADQTRLPISVDSDTNVLNVNITTINTLPKTDLIDFTKVTKLRITEPGKFTKSELSQTQDLVRAYTTSQAHPILEFNIISHQSIVRLKKIITSIPSNIQITTNITLDNVALKKMTIDNYNKLQDSFRSVAQHGSVNITYRGVADAETTHYFLIAATAAITGAEKSDNTVTINGSGLDRKIVVQWLTKLKHSDNVRIEPDMVSDFSK